MRLVLFTRYPDPGKAKTRLIPLVGPGGAAEVHRALTEKSIKTLQDAADLADGTSVEIRFTGADKADFARWLGDRVNYAPQCSGDLTDRLIDAAAPAPVILFGSDTPELSPDIVGQAINALKRHDVVIGPAEDGGYYLIGMNKICDLFGGISWSSAQVFDETIAKVESAGLSHYILPMLNDCDRPEDLEQWPALLNQARKADITK